MSDQAAPVYIEPRGSSYSIVSSSTTAPPFPDIPISLVYDIGDLLKRVARKLPVEKADLIKGSLLTVLSSSHAEIEIELPEQEGRSLWASVSAKRCREIHEILTKQEVESLRSVIVGGKLIEGYDADDIMDCLQATRECFKQAAERGYGIAFFAYE